MNQDFLISSKAGMARRLVKLSKVAAINLDPAIVDLAKCDLLTDADFEHFSDFTLAERAAAQAVFDYDFRAVFPSDFKRSSRVALCAAMAAKIKPIFIFTERHLDWVKLTLPLIEKTDYTVDDFIVLKPTNKTLDPDVFKNLRHGVLIYEETPANTSWAEPALLPMDFQKTVFLTNRRLISDLATSIEILFPASPHDILSNNNAFFRREIEQMGFKSSNPDDLAFLMNIVTDLLASTKAVTVDITPDEEEVLENYGIDTELFEKLERNIALGHLRLG